MKLSELNLHPTLQATLDEIGFVECTPIQEKAIPVLLKGGDVAGLAQTGTGKTATFLIPMIHRILKGQALRAQSSVVATADINSEEEGPSTPIEGSEGESGEEKDGANLPKDAFVDWRPRNFILILVPTRELAEQVSQNAKTLLKNTGLKCVSIYGGTSYDKQKEGLKDGVEFVVATPGRLIDLFKEKLVDLNQVRGVIFDEADRMFDMGFKDDMKFVLRRIPRTRQFLVFSATLNLDVMNSAYEFEAEPVEVNVSMDQAKAENVTDEILHVGQEEKPQMLLSLIKKHDPKQVIIFSNFKHNVDRIARFLSSNGCEAVGISSLLNQNQRTRVISQFKEAGGQNILVATDVAARGLDVQGVDMVFNYDLPDDAENYVHRIGRTGRAGANGLAFSMVSDRDVEALGRIERYLDYKVNVAWLENDEIISDFKPFPSEYGDRKRKSSGPARKPNREDRDRFKKSGRGPNRSDGEKSERSPRRPAQKSSPRRNSEEKSAEGGGTHRDRRTGRHDQGASRSEGRGDTPRKNSRPASRRKSQPRSEEGKSARKPNSAPQRKSASSGKRPYKKTYRKGSRTGAGAAPSSGGLGGKVSSFLKKIFKGS